MYAQQGVRRKTIRETSEQRPNKRVFFRYSVGEYYDVGEITFACNVFEVIRRVTERAISSSLSKASFSTRCNKGADSLPSLPQPSATLLILFNEQRPALRARYLR